MTREQVLQAVRAYCKSALTLTDAQVVVARGPGARPSGAHVQVFVESTEIAPGGHDGTYSGLVGSLTYTVSDELMSRVSCVVYGAAADEWADTLRLLWSTNHPAADVARTAGLSPGPASGTQDLSSNVDGVWEPRRQVTLTGYHRTTAAPADVDAISRIDVDADYQPGDIAITASSSEYPS